VNKCPPHLIATFLRLRVYIGWRFTQPIRLCTVQDIVNVKGKTVTGYLDVRLVNVNWSNIYRIVHMSQVAWSRRRKGETTGPPRHSAVPGGSATSWGVDVMTLATHDAVRVSGQCRRRCRPRVDVHRFAASRLWSTSCCLHTSLYSFPFLPLCMDM